MTFKMSPRRQVQTVAAAGRCGSAGATMTSLSIRTIRKAPALVTLA